MKLFETAFIKNHVSYERVYDTDTKKTEVIPIKLSAEWFEQDSRGKYRSILDPSIKLEHHQGSTKEGRNHWGFNDPVYRNIRENYWNEKQQDTYHKDPRVWYLDIETRVGTCSSGFPVPNKALEPISLIQIYDNKLETMIVFGLREWKHQDKYEYEYSVKYIVCDDEMDMINKFLQTFKSLDPLIVYAWNGNGFDFPYIYNRLKNLGIDTDRMSNHGKCSLKEKNFGHTTSYELKSNGHYYGDLLDIYKKFVFGEQASYSLDFTAELVLGTTKVQHTEYVAFDDVYTGKYVIPEYPTEKQKNSDIYKQAILGNWDEVKELAHSEFVHYGVIDTHLIKGIDDAKNFTALMFMVAEKMGVLVEDSMGTVKPWSKFITNKALLKNQVIPKLEVSEEDISIKGGFVAVPQTGKHEWIMSSDVNSMYPLLGMVGFNISPETFVPIHKLPSDIRTIILKYYNDEEEQDRFDIPDNVKLKLEELLIKYNYAMGINGAIFTKDYIGMIPEMVTDIYGTRKLDKKTMFKYEKKSLEIAEILKARSISCHLV